MPGSHAPAWEPIWYAFPRWSMGTRNLDSGLSATGTVFTGVTTFYEAIMFRNLQNNKKIP
ncbi:MAG: hypothetical protein KAU60_12625 [Desulfobacterales bacterium]|nr:hypothetical protein [Desulfobacterales bacterium]